MSLSRLFRVAIVAFVCAFSVNAASAQMSGSPEGQIGLGVTMTPALTSGAGSSVGLMGATVSYAISPAFHLGTALGVSVTNQTGTGAADSKTAYLFAPYARLLFMGNETFKPMVQAQFLIGSFQTDQNFSKMTFAIGAEHFVNRNFGIYGNVRLVDFDITVPKTTVTTGGTTTSFDGVKNTMFGFMAPTLGVEWFF